MTSTTMTASIAVWAITPLLAIKVITTVTAMRVIRVNTVTILAARDIVAVKAISH